ncbi:MAG: hypothetical protein KAI53_02735 [Candidatus Aenigmarchaeota archaeon]|nr:hypothetical protein [Candidatus Aenigmarchaeota archaeon]
MTNGNIVHTSPLLSSYANTEKVGEAIVKARLNDDKSVFRKGKFTLASGKKSDVYYDFRFASSVPETYRTILEQLANAVEPFNPDVLITKETGGLLWASPAAYILGCSTAYVRKKPKDHGTAKWIEGEIEGRNCVIIEDVNTTLSSVRDIVEKTLEYGGIPKTAVVVMDRAEYTPEMLNELKNIIRMEFSDTNFKLECLANKDSINAAFDIYGAVDNPEALKAIGRKVA